DPDTVLAVDLKLAAHSSDAKRLNIAAPTVAAPTMLTEWKLLPDEGQRLIYRQGTLSPANGTPDVSGFVQIAHTTQSYRAGRLWGAFFMTLIFTVLAVICWRWAADKSAPALSVRHILGAMAGLVAIGIAAVSLAGAGNL